jgi:hypothetical protein
MYSSRRSRCNGSALASFAGRKPGSTQAGFTRLPRAPVMSVMNARRFIRSPYTFPRHSGRARSARAGNHNHRRREVAPLGEDGESCGYGFRVRRHRRAANAASRKRGAAPRNDGAVSFDHLMQAERYHTRDDGVGCLSKAKRRNCKQPTHGRRVESKGIRSTPNKAAADCPPAAPAARPALGATREADRPRAVGRFSGHGSDVTRGVLDRP